MLSVQIQESTDRLVRNFPIFLGSSPVLVQKDDFSTWTGPDNLVLFDNLPHGLTSFVIGNFLFYSVWVELLLMKMEERMRLYTSIADEILGVDHAQPEKLVHSKMTFETINEFLVLWIYFLSLKNGYSPRRTRTPRVQSMGTVHWVRSMTGFLLFNLSNTVFSLNSWHETIFSSLDFLF